MIMETDKMKKFSNILFAIVSVIALIAIIVGFVA